MARKFTGKKARTSALSLVKKGKFEKARVVLREALDRVLRDNPLAAEGIFIDLGTIYFIEFFLNNKLSDGKHADLVELANLVPRLEGKGDDRWRRVTRSYLTMVSLVTERMPGLARQRGMEALGFSKINTSSYASVLLLQAFVYKQLSVVIEAKNHLDSLVKSSWAKKVRGEKQSRRANDVSLMTLLSSEILRTELEKSYGASRQAKKSLAALGSRYTQSERAIFHSRISLLAELK